ncbi:MAG TPA: Crp/Fnr family transcriptional regulator [Rectinemataceae bacterium]|nr:Crp/Fnr family transcriptional regulator [Rectinemataceae bacterium]
MEQGQTKICMAGDVVFAEGDEGGLMYVLLEGAIDLRKKVGKSETILKTVSTVNDFFGEMALIDGQPRSASAVATKASRLLVIDGPTFENMILTNGKFALKIIKVLSDRIRHSNSTIEALHEVTPRDRYIRGLVDFAQTKGEKIYDGRLKVPFAEFKVWANSRIGFSLEECDAMAARLAKNMLVSWTKEGGDLLISDAILREFPRRSESGQAQ